MKAFFIYPEFTREFRYADWLKIGIGAALLRQIGWEVNGFYWKSPRTTESLKRTFGEVSPDVAITLIHPDQAPMAVEINREIKSHRPQTVTLACGLWPTLSPDAAIQARVFDALVLAEWEAALMEFALAFQDQHEYTGIRNFWVKKRPNEIKRLPIRPPAELDGLPPPDRDLFPYPQVLQINGGEFPMQASRSCPFHCAFCHEPVLAAIQGAGTTPYRVRKPERIVEEAADLAHVFSPERILFVDELFPWDEEWLDEFAGRWAEAVKLPFTVTATAETLAPGVLDRLRKAGCDRVTIGVETGDESFRRTFSDRNSGNQALLKVRRQLADAGMELITTNMLGLPSETPESLEATLQLNRELQPFAIQSRVFDPIPHTPLAQYIEKHRIEMKERESETVDPDISRLSHKELTQKQISDAYDRLSLLDSVLRARRFRGKRKGYFDVLPHFAEGRFRSPWRRSARLATWKRGNDTREVLALRAPAEITFDFIAHPGSAFAFGITTEPALRGLRSAQPIQFGIKVAQDRRIYRVFKKILVPALDPDSRRWHDYVFLLREIRPGPCQLILQVYINADDLKKLAPDEEIWGGWSWPHLVDRIPTRQVTPVPVHAGAPIPNGEPVENAEPPMKAEAPMMVESPVHGGPILRPFEVFAERQEPGEPAEAPDLYPDVGLRQEFVISLDDEFPTLERERDALARQVSDLAARIETLEHQLAISEAEKAAAIRHAEEADRSAKEAASPAAREEAARAKHTKRSPSRSASRRKSG